MGESKALITREEAREIKLPLLPWRRVATIRSYAAELVIPGIVELEELPRTREGLAQMAFRREAHDIFKQYEMRRTELEGEGLNELDATVVALREQIGLPGSTQLTLFNNGEQ
jgi:NifB/MoaA-like Fe-S oxidoreductase